MTAVKGFLDIYPWAVERPVYKVLSEVFHLVDLDCEAGYEMESRAHASTLMRDFIKQQDLYKLCHTLSVITQLVQPECVFVVGGTSIITFTQL